MNKAGGVNGRQIVLKTVLDDTRSETVDATQQKQLIENNNVTAIVPMCGQDQGAAYNVAHDAGIPVFGWGPASFGFCIDTNMFSVNGCNIDVKQGDGSWMIPLLMATNHWDATTKKATPPGLKISFPANAGPGNGFEMSVIRSAQALGMTVVGPQADIPITTTDYSPYAKKIIDADAVLVDIFTGSAAAVGLAAALKSAGYKGAVQDFQTYDANQLKSNANYAAALEGEYTLLEYPVEQDNSPATIQETKDLAAVGWTSGLSTAVNLPYWMADMFVAALKAAGPNPTSATIAALGTNFTYTPTLEGGAGPVNYPAQRDAPSGCGSLVQVKDGKYVSVLKYHCYGGIVEGS